MMQYFGGGDPARLGAQVINGIGFLGAGTIIVAGRSRSTVIPLSWTKISSIENNPISGRKAYQGVPFPQKIQPDLEAQCTACQGHR